MNKFIIKDKSKALGEENEIDEELEDEGEEEKKQIQKEQTQIIEHKEKPTEVKIEEENLILNERNRGSEAELGVEHAETRIEEHKEIENILINDEVK